MSDLATKTETRSLRYDFNPEEIHKLSIELANKNKEKTLVEEEKASVTKQYGSRISEISATINKLANKVSDGFELRDVEVEIRYNKPEAGQKTIIRKDNNSETIEKMEPFEFNLFNQPKTEKDPDEDGFDMGDEFDSNEDEENIDTDEVSGANNVESDSGDPVIELIKKCETNGLKVKLPEGQIDKELFQQVKAKMEEIGGVWKAGRTQAFVFDEAPDELIWSIISRPPAASNTIKKRTPSIVAEKMVSGVEILGHDDVLIPFAGGGELLEEVWRIHGDHVVITVYEENAEAKKALLNRAEPVYMEGDDFLQSDSEEIYEVAICHPPLHDQLYIPVVKKMFVALQPGGTMVALTHPEWTTSRKKDLADFRKWLDEKEAYTEEIPEKDFQEIGQPQKAILIKITKAE